MTKSGFDEILSVRPDPLDVLKTTASVVDHARAVKVNLDAVKRAADALVEKRIEPPVWNYQLHYHDGTERTVNYLFLLDALNFCFWGKPRWKVDYEGKPLDGYWALAASLKRAAEENPRALDAKFLARISPQELADMLRGSGRIPLFTERWRNARELGTILKKLWDGEAARLVECAQRDAPRLAQMVAENFSSFNDVAAYDQREVRFFKRAQIVVTDLWGAFGGKDWGEFENIDHLTAFADYKLPQILRAWGILRYAPSLARKVDAQVELPAGSAEEIEIRAATLWAVEFLREELVARGRKLWSVQIDWILWNASQGKFQGMKPYHRVRTVYY
ncbi:MAG: queuosine salvage family protein [Chloroflexota bacterium]|nr:queuosine salvage family protein [Chloroflexota bacterium]